GARPHAMDRAELERRIRQRRQEGPFHRGADEHEGHLAAEVGRMGRFVPEPTDELARHDQPVADEQPRVDYFDERAARRADEDQSTGPGSAGFAPMGAGGIPGAAVAPSQVDWPSRDLDEGEPSDTAGPTDDAVAGAAAGSLAAGSMAVRAAEEPDVAAGPSYERPAQAHASEPPAANPYRAAEPYVPERANEPVAAAPYVPPDPSQTGTSRSRRMATGTRAGTMPTTGAGAGMTTSLRD